ncbi:cysteine protease ATG4C-like isoform X1 [Centruroides sculpturatus]|uniref:cysteine protease ATG4C-like isoform X1 n=1 Tax=Centruroides sculpturatus TaxID=218467 RepID=UPI000C6D09CD|nr:cysteine protease ATG4C-like isoform X1 [Centruroides sculpturatus]
MDARRDDFNPKWLSNIRPGYFHDNAGTTRATETNRQIASGYRHGVTTSSPPSSSASSRIDGDKTKTNSSCHSETDNSDKVKTKLMSMWNNMKYGWTVKVKTNFSYESPIWLLGKCYHKKLQGQESDFATRNTSMELFKQDFSSRIWFTYRREFPTLAGSNLTTDCGWGCMLRSGQMLLAQALVCHFLGREWKWNTSQTPMNEVYHRMIIKWFADHPCSGSPFSVHKLVSLGENSGKKAGEWYGPASVAYILKQAVENAAKEIPLLDSICIYVAQDCTIYKQDVFDLCTALQKKRSFCDNSLSDDKQNLSNKSCCCDIRHDYSETKMNFAANQSQSSSIKINVHCSNGVHNEKDTKELGQDDPVNNIQQVYKQLSDNYCISPSMFPDNTRNTFSIFGKQDKHTINNINHSLGSNKEENTNVTTAQTSVFCDYATNCERTNVEDISKSESCSAFFNYVNNLEQLDTKNVKQKRNSCSERRSFLLRSASVPPPSSEETNCSATQEENNGECNTESVDFLCSSSSSNSEHCSRWKSTIILVPVRLGGEILNRSYIPRVRDMLTQEHCIGIIGGRPRHSLYFIGWQDDKLIYLDPHYCQEVVDFCITDFPLQSFHCTAPRKMTCTRMDPSCTIGFYCKTKKDFLNFTRAINQILAPYKQKGDYPIFTVQEGKCSISVPERDVVARERTESLDQPWNFEDDLDTIDINNEDFVVI